MTEMGLPAPNPCASCPYRRDVPSGVWSEEDYEKLPHFDRGQPMELFQCHQNGTDSDKTRLCGGWVATHGDRSIGLRMAVVSGRLDPKVFEYTTDVPLFDSGAEACEHGLEEIDCPGPEAIALMEKISRVRPDVDEEIFW